MKHCKTCKWRARPVGAIEVMDKSVHRKCKHPQLSSDIDSDAAYGASDADRPQYEGIHTGPDFGCVHHEENE